MEMFPDIASVEEIRETAVSASGEIWKRFDPAEQIAMYPKPPLVIVFDEDTGKELRRKEPD